MAFMEQHLNIEHAMRLLRAGEFDDAEAIARQLLKRDKRNVDAIQLRGAIALKKCDYTEALKISQTYGGSLIVIEGHSDPLGILKAKQGGESKLVISQMERQAKNLSLERSQAVRQSFLDYCKKGKFTIDESQFLAIGLGISTPKFSPPRRKFTTQTRLAGVSSISRRNGAVRSARAMASCIRRLKSTPNTSGWLQIARLPGVETTYRSIVDGRSLCSAYQLADGDGLSRSRCCTLPPGITVGWQ